MRIIRIILALFLLAFNMSSVLANTPPPPTAKNASTNSTNGTDDDPIPPPGVPINQDLPFLIGAGLILGMTIIYRNKIKKASI